MKPCKPLHRHPLAEAETPIPPAELSAWPRCDASSPCPRLLLPSIPPSAGQPIVAGWAYQFIAWLNFVQSWTAPVDVERVRPTRDANEVAAEQVKAFLGRSPKEGAGRSSVRLRCGLRSRQGSAGLEGWCRILLRLRAGRCLLADPSLAGPPRPHRKAASAWSEDEVRGSSTWPQPSGQYMRGRRLRVGARKSLLEAASEGAGARRKGQPRAFAHRGRDAHRGGGGAAAAWRKAARAKQLWLWWHGPEGVLRTFACCGAPTSGASTWSMPSAFPNRFGMDHA